MLWPPVVVHQVSVKIEVGSNQHFRSANAPGPDSAEEEAQTFKSRVADPIVRKVPICSFSNDGPSHKIKTIVWVGESNATIATNLGTSHASVAGLGEAHPFCTWVMAQAGGTACKRCWFTDRELAFTRGRARERARAAGGEMLHCELHQLCSLEFTKIYHIGIPLQPSVAVVTRQTEQRQIWETVGRQWLSRHDHATRPLKWSKQWQWATAYKRRFQQSDGAQSRCSDAS